MGFRLNKNIGFIRDQLFDTSCSHIGSYLGICGRHKVTRLKVMEINTITKKDDIEKRVKRFDKWQMTLQFWTCKRLHTEYCNKKRDNITLRPSNMDFVVTRYFREMWDSGLM